MDSSPKLTSTHRREVWDFNCHLLKSNLIKNQDMDPLPGSEVLHEGYMVKSPPLETKPIPGYSLFKAVS